MRAPVIRSIYRLLAGNDNAAKPFAQLKNNVAIADLIVTVFYAASVYIAIEVMVQVGKLVDAADAWNLLWVLAWVPQGSAGPIFEFISLACVTSAIVAVMFHRFLIVRLAFFILFLFAASVPNSLGGINHPYHAWIFVAFIFVFLPSGQVTMMNRVGQMSYVTCIRAAQSLILLFYTMAGGAKLYQGIAALTNGQSGSLSYGALSWTLADRSLQTGTTPLLIDIVIANPLLATLMMWGVIYIQVVAVAVAFRPSLYAVWALALIAFHVGTWVLMEIVFMQHILLLVILFVMKADQASWRGVGPALKALPLFGRLFARFI